MYKRTKLPILSDFPKVTIKLRADKELGGLSIRGIMFASGKDTASPARPENKIHSWATITGVSDYENPSSLCIDARHGWVVGY